jgi:hypothetical protein
MANSMVLDNVGVLWYFGFNSGVPSIGREAGPSGPFNEFSEWADAPEVQYPMKAVRNPDGRIEVFALSPSGDLLHTWQTSPSDTDWSWHSWESLGGGPLASFDVILDSAGLLVVIAIAEDGAMRRLSRGVGWGDWEAMGIPQFGDGWPALSSNEDGHLQVFAINAGSKSVVSACQDKPGTDNWGELYQLIDPADTPVQGDLTVAINGDKRLELFATCADDGGNLLHAWQNEINGSWTNGWSSLGMAFDGPPAVANLGDGRLQLLAISKSLAYSNWQGAGAGGWVGWRLFPPTAVGTESGSVQLAANIDGTLAAVLTGNTGNGFLCVSQTAPTSGWGPVYAQYPPTDNLS